MVADTVLVLMEAELKRQSSCFRGPVAEVCRYATKGGRRVRSALLLGATQNPDMNAVVAATALELMHAATLLQDDIFDSGCVRRGSATAHVKFGKALATLASDCLLIRSLELAAGVHPDFFRSLGRAGRAMAEAEALEMTAPKLDTISKARSLDRCIASGKTAALFGTALHGAALLSGYQAALCIDCEQLGVEMGMTYQLLDDCIDVYGHRAMSGKDVRSDLAAGRLTLPILLSVAALKEQRIEIPLQVLQSGRLSPEQDALLQKMLASTPVRKHLQSLVLQRVSEHQRTASRLGIDVAALSAWSADVERNLTICYPASTCAHNEADHTSLATPPQVWQIHA